MLSEIQKSHFNVPKPVDVSLFFFLPDHYYESHLFFKNVEIFSFPRSNRQQVGAGGGGGDFKFY